MKKVKFLLMAVLMVSLCMGFVSCGEDEDNEVEQKEIVVTVDNAGNVSGTERFVQIDATNFYINDVKYTVVNGHLEVTGYDEAFFYGDATIISKMNYRGHELNVLKIGDDAFEGCKNLLKVIIADGVEEIGNSCFRDCTNLSYIDMPKGLATIGSHAFFGCI